VAAVPWLVAAEGGVSVAVGGDGSDLMEIGGGGDVRGLVEGEGRLVLHLVVVAMKLMAIVRWVWRRWWVVVAWWLTGIRWPEMAPVTKMRERTRWRGGWRCDDGGDRCGGWPEFGDGVEIRWGSPEKREEMRRMICVCV
ncbi:hypothetical protein Tco_0069131, partial [Tanacetum coccineum]